MSEIRVAVVTGAARGVGRGIALVLGEAGAVDYVTDRESRGLRISALPGTVEDTAAADRAAADRPREPDPVETYAAARPTALA